MVTNQKPTGRAASMPGGLLIGGLTSLLLTIVLSAILSKLLDAEIMEWEQIGYGIMTLLLVSAATGAAVACNKIKRQKLIVCALSGLIYFAVLIMTTALLFGGQYEAVGVTAALIMGGSMATGLLEMREGKQGHKRKRRTHRC